VSNLIENINTWVSSHPLEWQIVLFFGTLLVALLSYYLTRHIFLRGLAGIVRRSKSEIDDLLLDNTMMRRISYIPPLLVLESLIYLFPDIEVIAHKIIQSSLILVISLIATVFMTNLNTVYERSAISKNKPIKSYIQIFKIIIYIAAAIVILSILLGQPPWYLLTGLGAMTAVILLIFRDTILSFVTSLQISSNDLVRVGDWIEVPAYGADGDVIDIALHTIKIQNWDKTITTIPTHKLIEVSFKNWRGMQATGGRRIKRAVYIDQSSIKFCDHRMLKRFQQMNLLKDYIRTKVEELETYNREHGFSETRSVNGRRLTNIGTLRAYITAYLKQHPRLHHGLTTMVRQLNPGPDGLPLEIYCFASSTEWVAYEDIQSDIFDHILAIVPEFELRIFQNPSGRDFENLIRTGE
jgi:miniconductance mechanosensitive channel